jgi:uncharacterized protein
MPAEFKTIQDHVVKRLDNELPDYLTYHCTDHTLYVCKKAEYIARKEGASEEDIYLLKVAAMYHDIGFVESHMAHEKRGCEIAMEELPGFGFNDAQLKKICGMIRATQIPQDPRTKLEEIIADADLEYLATNLFIVHSERLYKELQHFQNGQLTRERWNEIQKDFIGNHRYHTDYCRRYKEHRKHKNLERLLAGEFDLS